MVQSRMNGFSREYVDSSDLTFLVLEACWNFIGALGASTVTINLTENPIIQKCTFVR